MGDRGARASERERELDLSLSPIPPLTRPPALSCLRRQRSCDKYDMFGDSLCRSPRSAELPLRERESALSLSLSVRDRERSLSLARSLALSFIHVPANREISRAISPLLSLSHHFSCLVSVTCQLHVRHVSLSLPFSPFLTISLSISANREIGRAISPLKTRHD